MGMGNWPFWRHFLVVALEWFGVWCLFWFVLAAVIIFRNRGKGHDR